jgi:hypothetical protein
MTTEWRAAMRRWPMPPTLSERRELHEMVNRLDDRGWRALTAGLSVAQERALYMCFMEQPLPVATHAECEATLAILRWLYRDRLN